MRHSILLILFFPILASAATSYVRGAIGYEQSRDTVLRDVDCSATTPPALFGCGFEARGDFGNFFAPEIAIGVELPMRSRVELALAHRSFDFDLRSNFRNTPDPQIVRAAARTTSLMVNGAIEVPLIRRSRATFSPRGGAKGDDGDPSPTRVSPFVTAGAGFAHNAVDHVNFAFPGIDPGAVTIAQGGERTSFAWAAGVGVSYAITPSLDLDLTARWQDLGEMRTEAGNAHIVRPSRTIDIDVAGLRAQLRSAGVSVGVRWRR